jgi:hypothetical protein
MKRAATIFFLVLVAIQTPAIELFRLPFLVEHFIKHQDKEGDSLLDFLDEHYAKNHQDADSREDEQLPFKNLSFYQIANAELPKVHFPDSGIPPVPGKKPVFNDDHLPQQQLAGIFHPPRA